MQRLQERLSEAAHAEEQLSAERLEKLRWCEAAREAEAQLGAAQLSVARAEERTRAAEWAREQIAAKFEQHVGEAERNIETLRTELGSCTDELWAALQAQIGQGERAKAEAAAARETATAAEARAAAAEARAAEAEARAAVVEAQARGGASAAAEVEALRQELAEVRAHG
jgi:hypothetical protein